MSGFGSASPTGSSAPYNQWLRKASVAIVGPSITYNLTDQFRFTFNTVQSDIATPNQARVRIYNLSDQTVATILGTTGIEFTKVIITAGYQPPGNFATVFQGTIKQIGHGRESNINSYLDVFAADGDLMLNYAVMNQTLAGPVTQQNQIDAIGKVVTPYGVLPAQPGTITTGQTGGILPRGKVFYGLIPDQLRALGKQRLTTWSVQNGTLVEIPLKGYLPGDVVVINSTTGLIGTPETTQQGITLTCLLNPNIKLGQRIQLNNKEINQQIITNRTADISDATIQIASEAADGIYRVVVHEFSGDTRGNDWYSHITALSIDPSAQPASSVLLYGYPPTSTSSKPTPSATA